MRLRTVILLLLPFWLAVLIVTPPLQTPDEDGHYGYVQSITRGEYPRLPADPTRIEPDRSPDLDHLVNQFALSTIAFRQQLVAFQQDTGQAGQVLDDRPLSSIQANHPPVYYVTAAFPYQFASWLELSSLQRFVVTRATNLLFYCLFLVFLFKTLRLLFSHRLSIGLTIFSGLQPMVLLLATAVNPEMAAVSFSTAAFYYGGRLVTQRRFTRKDVLWLTVVSALAFLSKTSAVLAIPVGIAAILAVPVQWKERGKYLALYLGLGAALISPWLIFNLQTYGVLLPNNFDFLFKARPDVLSFTSLIPTIYWDLTRFYQQVAGVFGWLDAFVFYGVRLTYMYILSFALVAGVVALRWRKQAQRTLGYLAIWQMFCTFLIMVYLSYYFHAHYIERAVLQGRYGLIAWAGVMILVAYALSQWKKATDLTKSRLLIVAAVWYYFFVLFHTLIPRYYV